MRGQRLKGGGKLNLSMNMINADMSYRAMALQALDQRLASSTNKSLSRSNSASGPSASKDGAPSESQASHSEGTQAEVMFDAEKEEESPTGGKAAEEKSTSPTVDQ